MLRRLLTTALCLSVGFAPVPDATRATADKPLNRDEAIVLALANAGDRLGTPSSMLTVEAEGITRPWGVSDRYYFIRVSTQDFLDSIPLWVDLETGRVLDNTGMNAEAATLRQRFGKLNSYVYSRLKTLDSSSTVRVAAWVDGPSPSAIAAELLLEEPAAEIVDGYVVGSDSVENDRLMRRMREIRADKFSDGLSAVSQRLTALGLEVDYQAHLAPMIFFSGTADQIRAAAGDQSVIQIVGSFATRPAIDSAMRTSGADHSHALGFDGSAAPGQSSPAKVAVVEYGNVNWSDPDLSCIPSSRRGNYHIPGTSNHVETHPTWVMSAIAAQCNGRSGMAPGATYMSVGTGGQQAAGEAQDYEVVRAVEYAVENAPYADIISLSLVQDTGQYGEGSGDGAQALEAYLDYLVDVNHINVVGSGGNSEGTGGNNHCPYGSGHGDEVQSPGSAFNVLTVGGINEHYEDEDWSNDTMWLDSLGTSGFCYLGPFWNDNTDPQDRVKPEIAAPAVCVQAGPVNNGKYNSNPSPSCANGTSIAVPQVAGAEAILMGQKRDELAGYPMKMRAILIASSYLHQTPGGTLGTEGYGSLHAFMATHVVDRQYGDFGQYTFTKDPVSCDAPSKWKTLTPGHYKVRYAVSWNSHGAWSYSGSGTNASYSDELKTDLNLYVRDYTNGNVLVTKGTNTSSNNEIVDWFAESGHTYKIQIKPVDWTCNWATESAGWAWVKYYY